MACVCIRWYVDMECVCIFSFIVFKAYFLYVCAGCWKETLIDVHCVTVRPRSQSDSLIMFAIVIFNFELLEWLEDVYTIGQNM